MTDIQLVVERHWFTHVDNSLDRRTLSINSRLYDTHIDKMLHCDHITSADKLPPNNDRGHGHVTTFLNFRPNRIGMNCRGHCLPCSEVSQCLWAPTSTPLAAGASITSWRCGRIYKTRSTVTPAYLASLLESRRAARTLRSSNDNFYKIYMKLPRLSLCVCKVNSV